MRSRSVRLLFYGVLLAVAVAGCAPGAQRPSRPIRPAGLPDLVPIPHIFSVDPFSVSFCRLNSQGQLVVLVLNQDMVTGAGASHTRVEFSPGGSVSKMTDPVGPAGTAEVSFDVPAACFNPDCNFRITVDSDGEVSESNEGNNTSAWNLCIG